MSLYSNWYASDYTDELSTISNSLDKIPRTASENQLVLSILTEECNMHRALS